MGPIIGYALIYRRNAHHLSCAMQKMPYNFVVRCVVHVQLIVRADRDSSSALARVCVFLPDGSATETMIVETCLMNRTAVSSLLTSLYCCRHQFIPCPAFSVVSLPLRLEWNNGSYIYHSRQQWLATVADTCQFSAAMFTEPRAVVFATAVNHHCLHTVNATHYSTLDTPK